MSCDRVRACPSVDDTRTGSPPHKIERPSTAQSLQSKVKPQTQPKSFIPTFKSLSQPPSIAPMESPHKHDSLSKGMEEINSSLMDSELLTDINAISDEFKDCLESVKLDFDGENAELDTLHLGTAEEILNNLKTPDEIDSPPLRHGTKGRDTSPKQRILGRGSAPIRNLSRKNSSSGIPVSVSLANKVNNSKNATPRQQQLPRRGSLSPNGQSSTRRAATTVGSPEKTVPNPTVKRNLDIFLTKKRRYETLRKEIQTKQKPLVDLYNALSQMKKKLAELGEQVSIDPIPMIEESEVKPPVRTADVGISGEDSIEVINVDVHILDEVRKSADDLRANSVELCKNMMEKRNVLLSSFENIARLDQNSTLLHELELHRNENVALNNFLSKTIQEQENDLKDMIKKMSHLKIIPIPVSNPSQVQVQKQGTPPPPAEPLADYTKELQERTKELETSEAKIKQLEKKLSTVQNELKSTQAANAAGQENGESLRSENDKLKHKISVLEKLIETEKRKAQHDVDRLKTTEISSKTLKGKIKELENAKAQNESKINTLNAEIRIAQSKLKTAEKNFEKELSEMNKSRNLDKAVIERLNRDKSTFETRMAELNQQATEAHKEYTERDQRQRQEVETMRQELDVQTNTVHQLRLECEKLQNELNTIHIHAQQSSELLRKKDDGYALITERECELQIEVVAQRAAMKALQEKVDANAMEKIRFIETIENMNGSTNEMRDEIVKTLVQKEEEITQLHQHLKKRDDDLANRRIEVQNLKAKIDNLQEHIQAMKEDENEADLKNMIKEGRSKLEEALVKSLENEHKLIKYEHEMAQKLQTIAHLENTLKLRDGLIGVLKAKKEELTMENKSLNKYSEEIRSFVIEAKEELREKTEIITQLQSSLDNSRREILKYEHRLHEVENQLTLTNEKRYKLQDTVSQMERALQARSADDVELRTGNKFLKYKR